MVNAIYTDKVTKVQVKVVKNDGLVTVRYQDFMETEVTMTPAHFAAKFVRTK